MGKPRITWKYPTYPRYPEIPESKKGTRKYPIIFFDTPTRPEPDPLPGILSNTRPDPILKNPTCWALLETHLAPFRYRLSALEQKKSCDTPSVKKSKDNAVKGRSQVWEGEGSDTGHETEWKATVGNFGSTAKKNSKSSSVIRLPCFHRKQLAVNLLLVRLPFKKQ